MRISVATACLLALIGCTNKAEKERNFSEQITKDCEISLRFADRDNVLAPYATVLPAHVAKVLPAPPQYDGDMSLQIELTPEGNSRLVRDEYNKFGNRLAYFCGKKEIQRAVLTGPVTSPVRFHLGDKPGT